MTLTNQTGISATELVRTDIRPGANVRLPNGMVLSEDAQILLNKSIIAKPLGLPAAETLEIKDSNYRYRWVNRSGAGGSLFARRKAQGFTLATTKEVNPLSVDLTNDTGEIRLGDLVLMKITVGQYQAAMKATMTKALILQRDKKYITNSKGDTPSSDIHSDDAAQVHSASEINKQAGDGKYMQTFEPSESVLEEKMGKDITKGRK
jgi:hypothetical protein